MDSALNGVRRETAGSSDIDANLRNITLKCWSGRRYIRSHIINGQMKSPVDQAIRLMTLGAGVVGIIVAIVFSLL